MAVGATVGAGSGGVVIPGLGAVPGAVVGGVAGFIVGGVIWGIQMWKPNLISDIKRAAFKEWDHIKKLGNSTVQGLKTVKDGANSFIKNSGDTWNKEYDFTRKIQKTTP